MATIKYNLIIFFTLLNELCKKMNCEHTLLNEDDNQNEKEDKFKFEFMALFICQIYHILWSQLDL